MSVDPQTRRMLYEIQRSVFEIFTTTTNTMRKVRVENLLIKLEGWCREELGQFEPKPGEFKEDPNTKMLLP